MLPEAAPTAGEALRLGRGVLGAEEGGSAERWLLHVLGWSRPRLFMDGDQPLEAAQWQRYRDGLARLRQGEPVAYLTGTQPFWNFDLQVGPAVLIPRPDTERLVELALARIPVDQASRVADLGTGSGAIALALALERPAASVVAVDRSEAALRVAAGNRRALGAERLALLCGDWSGALASASFDVITSNPPYLADDDPHLLRDGLHHEPRSALVAGSDGLDDLRLIVRDATRVLRPGGWLLLEHGYAQGAAVRALLAADGFVDVETARDYGGRDRVGLGRLPP